MWIVGLFATVFDHGSEDDDFCETDNGVDTDSDSHSHNEEDYSFGSDGDSGSNACDFITHIDGGAPERDVQWTLSGSRTQGRRAFVRAIRSEKRSWRRIERKYWRVFCRS